MVNDVEAVFQFIGNRKNNVYQGYRLACWLRNNNTDF